MQGEYVPLFSCSHVASTSLRETLLLFLKKDSQSGLMFWFPLTLQGICIHSTQDHPHPQGLLAALVG